MPQNIATRKLGGRIVTIIRAECRRHEEPRYVGKRTELKNLALIYLLLPFDGPRLAVPARTCRIPGRLAQRRPEHLVPTVPASFAVLYPTGEPEKAE